MPPTNREEDSIESNFIIATNQKDYEYALSVSEGKTVILLEGWLNAGEVKERDAHWKQQLISIHEELVKKNLRGHKRYECSPKRCVLCQEIDRVRKWIDKAFEDKLFVGAEQK